MHMCACTFVCLAICLFVGSFACLFVHLWAHVGVCMQVRVFIVLMRPFAMHAVLHELHGRVVVDLGEDSCLTTIPRPILDLSLA